MTNNSKIDDTSKVEATTRKREKSRDIVSSLEARLTRLESIDMAEEISDLVQKVKRELREELLLEAQDAIGVVGDTLRNELKEEMTLLRDAIMAEIDTARGDVVTMKGEIANMMNELAIVQGELMVVKGECNLFKLAMAQGNVGTQDATKIEIPKPKTYSGECNAKELDNFLWNLEKYFKAANILDDERTLYCNKNETKSK